MARKAGVAFLMILVVGYAGVSVAADQAEFIVSAAGHFIPRSPTIIVGEVKSVLWDADAPGPGKSGKATFIIRKAVRGGTEGAEIVLPVQELKPSAELVEGAYFWEGIQFTERGLFLIFIGKDVIQAVAPIKALDDPIVKDLTTAVAIDSMKPDAKLKALQDILGQKSLKPVLLVNYAVEGAGLLVRNHTQACSMLLAVATDQANPARVRWAALDAIKRNLADEHQQMDRPIWLDDLRMLAEAAPKMHDSPLVLMTKYSSLLSTAIGMGSYETVAVPKDLKVGSPLQVAQALNTITLKLDVSAIELKDELAAAKAPATVFATDERRRQRVAELESSIAETGKSSESMKVLAKSVLTQLTSSPEGDRP